jgi:hypothetical protein
MAVQVKTQEIEELNRKWAEKIDEIEYTEALNQTLILREHMSSQELQDVRKELINLSLSFWLSIIMMCQNACF